MCVCVCEGPFAGSNSFLSALQLDRGSGKVAAGVKKISRDLTPVPT